MATNNTILPVDRFDAAARHLASVIEVNDSLVQAMPGLFTLRNNALDEALAEYRAARTALTESVQARELRRPVDVTERIEAIA